MVKKVIFIALVIFGVVGFSYGVIYLSEKYLVGQPPVVAKEISCIGKGGEIHQVVIENDIVKPNHINAKLCDSISILNKDDKNREIAFGQHDKHVTYNGVEEKLVKRDQSLVVKLNKAGEYIFHDHDQDEVKGSFSVTNE